MLNPEQLNTFGSELSDHTDKLHKLLCQKIEQGQREDAKVLMELYYAAASLRFKYIDIKIWAI